MWPSRGSYGKQLPTHWTVQGVGPMDRLEDVVWIECVVAEGDANANIVVGRAMRRVFCMELCNDEKLLSRFFIWEHFIAINSGGKASHLEGKCRRKGEMSERRRGRSKKHKIVRCLRPGRSGDDFNHYVTVSLIVCREHVAT
eukprot:10790598-Ditylum_brightwellii.AAC.2